MERVSSGSYASTGLGAKLKLLLLDYLKAAVPALLFGLLAAVIIGPAKNGTGISSAMILLFGTAVERLEDVNLLFALFFFAPPLLQLVFLGSSIPREVKTGAYVLTREKGRAVWYVKKLIKVILLSLTMSLLTLLPVYLYSRFMGVGADELLLRSVAELMATWGLCQCAFTVFSNTVGLVAKPLYLLFLTLFLYAAGLVLMASGKEAGLFFPTVQGMLYAHNSVFGRLDEGFFTPVFSAAYLSVSILALGLLGGVLIRKKDIL